jgi:hypothetical protein
MLRAHGASRLFVVVMPFWRDAVLCYASALIASGVVM